MGSSQEPVPDGSVPLRRARWPSSTSVAAAAASTPNGSSGCSWLRPSAAQNAAPNGMRDRLRTFGSVQRRLGGASDDIACGGAYHQPDWMMLMGETGDEISRCLVAGGDVRIVAVTATGVAREAIRRHGATGASAIALARGLTSGLLLATLTKDEERVTMQLLGDGPLEGLTVDATS